MRIKVLGCSGGVGPGLRTTSLLVNDHVLIDAGTGVCDLSLDQMGKITDIFLTHSHLDHVAGLAFMADNLFDLIDHPLRVHATAPTLKAIRDHLFNWVLWPDFSELPDKEHGMLQWNEVTLGAPYKVNGHVLSAFEVLHTVPGVGYSMESAIGCFAFSGDTYACESLWSGLNRLKRLDKLMIEVAFVNEDDDLARIARHFTPALLGEELKKLKHKPHLYLTHHKPGAEAEIEAECKKALKDWDYQHLRRGDVISF